MAQRVFSCMFPFNFHLKQNSCHRPRAKNRNPFQLLANQRLMFLLYKHREDWLLPGKHGKCLFVSGTTPSPPKLTVELYFQCYNQLCMIILFFWFLFSFQSPHRISVMDQWHLPGGSEVSGYPWYTGRHVLLEKGNVFKSLRS